MKLAGKLAMECDFCGQVRWIPFEFCESCGSCIYCCECDTASELF